MKFAVSFLAFLVFVTSLNPFAFAEPDSNQTHTGGDSQFFLANPDLYMPENYNPEKMQEEERANFALRLLRKEMPIDYAGSAPRSRAVIEVEDPYVFRTQRWLNETYGHVSGFGSVPETGKTGWDTVYGLTRALQIELGITALANNFGPGTRSLYSQNILTYGSNNRKVSILIGALLCKGYDPGGPSIPVYNANDKVVFSTNYDSGIEYRVKQLKEQAGFINPNGDVTANVMKALLSMDSFTLLSSYGGKAEVRAMQQKFNRKYEAYFETDTSIGGLIPCDGIFGRNTNTALIYALQATEGLPVGFANGNFGPTTILHAPQIPYEASGSSVKSYQNNYYTPTQISEFTELLQFSLFLNGFGSGICNGSFDADTKASLSAFQRHYALPVTVKVDIDDWMSLFLSSGNPDRSAVAADCAQPLTSATVTTLVNNGYKYIGRYLTGTYSNNLSKALSVQEANDIIAGGLRFFPIYQSGQYLPGTAPDTAKTYFTVQQAEFDANAAIAASLALGIPSGTIIYFAVDFDALDAQITSHIIPYFQKVNEIVSQSIYKTGVYGTRNLCSRVAAKGYSCSSFVAGMSTGWSGNLGFKMPNNWAFSQIKEYTIGSGAGSIGIDKNAFSGKDQGVSELNVVRKKAIYVLPGYMGSKLYTQNGTQFFIEGTDMGLSMAKSENIPLLADIAQNAINRKTSIAMLDSNGSGSTMKINPTEDIYGTFEQYKILIEGTDEFPGLRDELGNEYAIEFFPYNWLGDLNDSVIKLENDIKSKKYSEVVFVTHSTGGLLASAYIAKSNENKLRVKKAILVAAPLFGTYASLMPLETGSGALIGEPYKIADEFVQVVKTAEITPMPEWLRSLLRLVPGVYDGANNWVKDVSHNSPTTYHLLPSLEYIQLMPQLEEYEDVFKNVTAVTNAADYYNILNGSANINPNLTNGNNRSHQYFRDTALGGDIVSVLRSVDTVLIASSNGPEKTETIAIYTSKLFGGTKLKEMVFQPEGDGTVHYKSATANLKEGDTSIRIIEKDGIDHGDLVKDSEVIAAICNEIKAFDKEDSIMSTVNTSNANAGMSNLIKINYSCDSMIQASIFDDNQNEVAHISANDYFGFNGSDFIHYSYADDSGITDATIYMPNQGYKIVFSYGNAAGANVDFNAEVSTLNHDGWKDVSVTKTVGQTLTSGIILSIDGTINAIDSSNISTIINGMVKNYFTEWELADTLKLNLGNAQAVTINGSQAVQVASLLTWTSSNESVATVSSGVVTAVGYGKTTISATDGNKSSVCEVVIMQNATTVNFADVNMFIGERKVANPIFTPATATETDMKYTYGNGNVIKIDEYGVIHAIASGTVTVTGTTEYGISNTFVVTVVDSDFTRRIGDVNGDSWVDVPDLIRIKRHIVGLETLTGKDFLAADVDGDEYITPVDIVEVKKIILGIG